MPLFLASLTLAGLGDWLREQNAAVSPVLITNASRELADAHDLLTMVDAEFAAQGIAARRLDVLTDDPAALRSASAIVMSGGDPFRLLADLRARGADRLLRAAHRRGVPIAGQSAGALVCGPSLEPMRLTSPFPPPPDLDLDALALTTHLVLPHQDRSERAALHRQAAQRFRRQWSLTPLWDDEALLVDDDNRAIIRREHPTQVTRTQLVTAGSHRFLVAEDKQGLLGFVYYRQARSEPDQPPRGEVDLTHVDARGKDSGAERRLLQRATWNLLCEGFDEALLARDPAQPPERMDLTSAAGEG